VAGILALSACSGSSGGSKSTAAAPSSSSPPAASPLTGLRASDNPVVAVKIEDTANGRPQAGTDKADLVYVEQVEGGLTRLLAVFNSSLPKTVEPVRSVRANDPELASEFGNIIFVASGGSARGLGPLLRSSLKPVINDRNGRGFSRDSSRPVPYNLRADLTTIADKVHGPKAADIGLTWSARLTAAQTAQTKPGPQVATRVGATSVGFRWDAKSERYVRIIDGRVQKTVDGSVIDTPNVIVQFCHVRNGGGRDAAGNSTRYTSTIGHGRAVVFRNGRRIEGTWSRPAAGDGTKLTTSDGKPIPLTPGGAWFALVATDAPLS
jgi:hypothetical protein